MRKGNLKLLAAVLFGAAFINVFALSALADSRTILDGIYADNIPLGGYTEDEAEVAVSVCVDELSNRNITLYTVNDEEVTITPKEVGFKWSNPEIIAEAASLGHTGNIVSKYKAMKDLSYTNKIYHVEYSVDDALIRQILEEKCTANDIEAVNGALTLQDGKFIIDQGQTGIKLDVDTSAANLKKFLCEEWTGENTAFHLTIVNDDPEGTYEQLSLVKDLLGAYHTSYKTSGSARCANIANGARLINGSLIFPGEEYSFFNHVAPFTLDNGYKVGAAYSAGMVVDSIGGGICQVSSTLYNATLYAELEVTNRKNHGMIVGYVDPARDATISEASGIDFTFVNNTDAPIYIQAYTTDDKQIFINIYGHETRPEGREVEYESEILSRTVPEGEKIYTDPSLPIGTVQVQAAHIGYKANLWKIVNENGETTRELVNTSSYAPVQKYATVGTATDNPVAAAAIQSAIDSGSIDIIKQTAASLKAGQVPLSEDPNAAALAQYEAALAAMQNAGAQ